MADLTFSPSGVLFGWVEACDDDLYTIDLSTGAATLVGESGLGTGGSGLAMNASGQLFFAGEGNAGDLDTIDPSTGVPTMVAILNGAPGEEGD